jgi:predicted Zn-dependent protease
MFAITNILRSAVVVLSLSVMIGCASDRQVVSQATQMHSGLQPAVITDPELSNYLQEVGDRIITVAREMDQQQYGPDAHRKEDSSWMFSENMKFHLVNSKTLNAFTTGGEHMYIYSELLMQCKNEDELAAVMAHEYGHVYGRHVHKGMNRQYAMLGVAAAAGVAGYALASDDHRAGTAALAASGTLLAGKFVGMGFTRKDEAEADKLGFDFYARAGWDPNQFAGFFQTMIDQGHDTTPEMMSDHPTLASRVEAAKKYAAELPPDAKSWRRPPVADAAKFEQIKQRAVAVGAKMPNDETLAKAQSLLSAFPSCVSPIDQPDQEQAQKQLKQEIRNPEKAAASKPQ